MDSAWTDSILAFVGLAALVAGLAVGLALGRRTGRWAAHARELETELAASRDELAGYRAKVADHFAETSDLIRDLTLQYRSVYQHLADGARSLCPDRSVALEGGFEALAASAGKTSPASPATERTSPGKGILFLCTGNSCRSQMAEGFARRLVPPDVHVLSAGTKPAGLNPRAVAVMQELGIDISQQRSKDLSEIPLDEVGTVVTLCDDAAERCPTLASSVARMHWPIADPARVEGPEEEVLRAFRQVRDEIADRVRVLMVSGA